MVEGFSTVDGALQEWEPKMRFEIGIDHGTEFVHRFTPYTPHGDWGWLEVQVWIGEHLCFARRFSSTADSTSRKRSTSCRFVKFDRDI